MKVVSWNVHRCIGTDRLYRPERIAAILASFDADVIALQEVDSSLKTASGQDQLSFLADQLKMTAVMAPTLKRDYGVYGNALLSRLPILSRSEHDLSYRKREPRGVQIATLSTPQGPLRVVNTHLGLKYWERSFQIDRLLAKHVWPTLDERVAVVGDFNEWFPLSGNNFRLTGAFTYASPRRATFPSTWPRFALDRVFLSGPVRIKQFVIPQVDDIRVASDHLPLLAHLEILAR